MGQQVEKEREPNTDACSDTTRCIEMEAEEKEYGEGFVQIRGTIWRSS